MNVASQTMEALIDRFEEAWSQGEPPRLDEFLLPPDHIDFDRLLSELVKIDMEYRWRSAAAAHRQIAAQPSNRSDEPSRAGDRPREAMHVALVEAYAVDFPRIVRGALMPIDLIAEEYRIRRRWGDNPPPSTVVDRFPQQAAAVEVALRAVDAELAMRVSFVERRSVDKQPATIESRVPANRHTLQVGQQIDDFRLLNELGQGAFARVFLAQQVSMQRLVALKISDQKSLESPVLSQLEHANIVRVFDERQIGTMYLMYMQYVAGGSLREAMQHLSSAFFEERNGPRLLDAIAKQMASKGESADREANHGGLATMDWESTVAWIGARVADALNHSHQLGVLHRDIKPDNILMTSQGQPMLADFNLSFGATVRGSSVDKSFGGSLAYMSPEHLRVLLGEAKAECVDASSDVYSLGAVLYELLHGRRPFEPPSESARTSGSLVEHLEVRQHRPAAIASDVERPDGLEALILQCMSFEPSQRPASASRLARRLQLLSFPSLRDLLSPAKASWPARWARQPIVWFLVLGMIPNAILSPLNIWANHRIAIENFDRAFFHRIEEPVVNAIAFPLGILLACWLAVPVSRAIGKRLRREALTDEERSRAAVRSLRLPAMTTLVIFVLWASSGIVFPWWNQWATGSRVDSIDVLGFFLSQVLHGLIAACLSFILVSLVVLRSFFVQLLPQDADAKEQGELETLQRQLGWAIGCLEMTPMFAILTIALSDQFDKLVFVALAIVGFVSHLVASFVTPQLRSTIEWLKRALRPSLEGIARQ